MTNPHYTGSRKPAECFTSNLGKANQTFINPFTSGAKSVTFRNVLAKSSTEPENSSNYSAMANNSTPFNYRAFFVRSTRTPKENNPHKSVLIAFLSMVGRNGKGSPFAVFIAGRFLSPLRTTAQTLRSLAVVPEKRLKGLSAMIYKFLLLGKKRLRITVRANSEAEARQKLQLTSPALCVARINPRLKGGVK